MSRVGSPCAHRDKLVLLELQFTVLKRLRNEKAVRNLAGEKPAPEIIDGRRRELLVHGLDDLGCRDGPGMRETLQQWCEAEKMIAMCVGDVNCGEVLAARDDPAQQSLRLLDREKSVHQDGISLAADERRRICHPHQLFLAGRQITSETRPPYRK